MDTERADVAVTEGEGLKSVGVVGRLGHVVGHQQVRVADLFVHLYGPDEIDVALVRVHFHEIVAPPADVAEMHVEDLLARAEIADQVVDFLAGVVEHLGHRALAEVQRQGTLNFHLRMSL